jgi:hypothetical protein
MLCFNKRLDRERNLIERFFIAGPRRSRLRASVRTARSRPFSFVRSSTYGA